MLLLWIESLAGGKELVSVWSGRKPQRDDCKERMQGETRAQELKQMRDKKTCGETERDAGRPAEAHVAPIPRTRSDSGQLMTGIRRHSESESGSKPSQLKAPFSLVPNRPHGLPRLPRLCGVLPPVRRIHLSARPRRYFRNITSWRRVSAALGSTGRRDGTAAG